MEIKHQVFVSSTYVDLKAERKEVIHALLELDCIPAGMELFPATDEDAWSLIKEVIDGCDYYILILAGKYGSTNKEGVGYTEMEYDYALSTGKPILSFVHENIDDLKSGKVESTEIGKSKLEDFRSKVLEKHCKFWNGPSDLRGKVSRSMIQLKKKHPSEGWVPGKYAADPKMLSELESLRLKVIQFELKASSQGDLPPENIEKLKHGEDLYVLPYDLKIDKEGKKKETDLEVTWDRIFEYCGPVLAGECTNAELLEKIRLVFYHAIPNDIRKYNHFYDLGIPYVCEDQIKVQLQALGLMEHGIKKRAVADTNTYWKMTAYGEKYLIQISALKK